MITPAGKVRHQVNQGPYRNEPLWDNELLKKFAVTGAELGQKPGQKPGLDPSKPPVPPDLQNALDQSNSSSLSGKVPGTPDGRMPGEKQAPVNPQAPGGRSPASRFLGANPDDNSGVSTQMILQEETKKVRQFIGNDFGLRMVMNKDGSITVAITPPQQQPITDPSGFIEELIRTIGGVVEQKESDTPPANEAGPITVSYMPRALQKVRKP